MFAKVGTGEGCGGMLGITCEDPADFCNVPAYNMCGAADGGGVCTPKPTECPAVSEPVCTCGGGTFESACEAFSQGFSVAYEGECRT